MDKAYKAKRDKFVKSAVDSLQALAVFHGFAKISKETLALIIQNYRLKYDPPNLPKARAPKLRRVLKVLKGGNNGK